MSDLTVAQTIITQMGGQRRLAAMVGASNFAGDNTSVQFSFKGSRKANKCRVEYDAGADLYTFQLWKWNKRTLDLSKVYELEGVYFDMLIDLFESETELYLSL